jgi:hypothetical protein
MKHNRFTLAAGAGILLAVMSVQCTEIRSWFGDEASTVSTDTASDTSAPTASPDPVVIAPSRMTVEVRFRFIGPETVWDGAVSVDNATIIQVAAWPTNNRSKIEGNHFVIRQAGGGQPRNQPGRRPALHVTLDPNPGAILELTPKQGKIRVALDELDPDQPREYLDGRITIQRIGHATRVTRTPQADEDYPAVTRGPDGSLYVAYMTYHRGTPIDKDAVLAGDFATLTTTGHGDQVMLARFDGNRWFDAEPVTEGRLDVQRPTVALDAQHKTWVTWSQNQGDNWDLYQRSGRGKIQRLTSAAGADINAVSVVDAKGAVWWAWQGWRDGNFEILVSNNVRGDAEPIRLSRTAGNEWSPAIAADSLGNVFVAWDSYDRGNYDVRMCRIAANSGQPGPVIDVAATERFEARPSLVVDAKDRVWIAHELEGVNWGKDYAALEGSADYLNKGNPLYLDRTVVVRCLVGDTLQRPVGEPSAAWSSRLNRPKCFPRLGLGGDGRIWLTFRTHPVSSGAGENWASYITGYDGERWTPIQTVPKSSGLVDNRPVITAGAGGRTYMVQTADRRISKPQPRLPRNMDLNIVSLATVTPTSSLRLKSITPTEDADPVPPVHAAEAEDIRRLRTQRVRVGGTEYRFLRGEFHRHTEYTSHRDQDGALEEMFRYGLDAADLDWIGNGDHDNGAGREYDWWSIQKTTSLYHHAEAFYPLYTYERSNLFPNGHRNVIFTRRGIRPLPRGDLTGTATEGTPDTKLLYKYLHHFDGICASHTSGTRMGTDWRDNDPEVEPIVEIYQGHRHSYEHFGAPRTATPATNMGGFQPAGYVWNALARGIRFGFQSSSDHRSTHMSYAIVLATEPSREGVVEAFRARRCYGATDNILLVVRCGDHLMGGEFEQDRRVTLNIHVVGTTPIADLDIIRDNGYVYSTHPNRAEIDLEWSDKEQFADTTSYYYVRVVQSDGNIAWSSPIWVHYAPKSTG